MILREILVFASAAKTAHPPLARIKLFHHVKANTLYRNDYQLRNALHWLHGEFGVSAIPARYEKLALIIRIDKPD